MGGDHKCPVCQATFTRPQHVARHMRSHTGDRPYKCQHCGDQFARSDLLSRHVNKCHANEKPPVPTGNTRRKGSASASRATTSKQACDQCVQSSLPCDGCNPCAKCVGRKCRCTFVKFHRQTAPAGPGHDPHPSNSSNSSLSSQSSNRLQPYHSTEEFFLGPPPSLQQTQPTFAPSDYPTTQGFSLPQIFGSEAGSLNNELAMKYRAQQELARRGTGGPSLYASNPQSQWNGYSQPPPPPPPPPHHHHPQDPAYAPTHTSELIPRYLPDTDDLMSSSSSTRQYLDSASDHWMTYGNYSMRRGSMEWSGSDAGSSASHSNSIPSSASSSNLHLPSMGRAGGMGFDSFGALPGDDGRAPLSIRRQFTHSRDGSQSGGSSSENAGTGGGPRAFSSAFGLMSLEDPNTLGGVSSESSGFFNAAMSMPQGDPDDTPMPAITRHGHGHTRGSSGSGIYNMVQTPTGGGGSGSGASREAELRELRDFWKQYMSTPLTGPGPSALLDGGSGSGGGMSARTPSTPSSAYRRQRVNSLPTVKTPPAIGGPEQPHYLGFSAAGVPSNQNQGGRGTGGTSSVRTTLHEDLSHYQEAVANRQMPTNLTLVPPKPRNAAGSNASSPLINQQGWNNNSSRPSTALGTTSSLAGALSSNKPGEVRIGSVTFNSDQVKVNTHHHPSNASSSSRESSVDYAGSDGSDPYDNGLRPSFKRLPSQTLGPTNAKRTLLSPAQSHSSLADGLGNQQQRQINGLPRSIHANEKANGEFGDGMMNTTTAHRAGSVPPPSYNPYPSGMMQS